MQRRLRFILEISGKDEQFSVSFLLRKERSNLIEEFKMIKIFYRSDAERTFLMGYSLKRSHYFDGYQEIHKEISCACLVFQDALKTVLCALQLNYPYMIVFKPYTNKTGNAKRERKQCWVLQVPRKFR